MAGGGVGAAPRAALVCKGANRPAVCAKVGDKFRVAGGGPGWQVAGIHSQVPGLGHRVSGSGTQVQVQVRGDRLPNRHPLTASTYHG